MKKEWEEFKTGLVDLVDSDEDFEKRVRILIKRYADSCAEPNSKRWIMEVGRCVNFMKKAESDIDLFVKKD